MTSSHHVHLTCLLRFPVYRYLYPPPHVNSNDFTRHQKEDAHESQKKCKRSRVFSIFPGMTFHLSPSLSWLRRGRWEIVQTVRVYPSCRNKVDMKLHKSCSRRKDRVGVGGGRMRAEMKIIDLVGEHEEDFVWWSREAWWVEKVGVGEK